MKEIRKIDYSEYKDKYDESVKEKLHSAPADVDIESIRAFIYGYTFTDDYAEGEIPDELSMDYWEYEADDLWDEESEELDIESLDDSDEEVGKDDCDMYEVFTLQERRILEAIDSTGDGKSPETALCVIDVHQEYEYLHRVFPYSVLKVSKQSVSKGTDCLEFEPNAFGVERIYFDMNRRFEVGYPGCH